MHIPNDIEHTLEKNTPTLSQSEREVLWNALSSKLGPRAPIPSPFMFTHIHIKTMASLLLILMLVLGGTGTAIASDASRPGDLLFPVERALENTRLKLAQSDTSRNELKVRYANERLGELREILGEESTEISDDVVQTRESLATSTSTTADSASPRKRTRVLHEEGEARVGATVQAILAFLDEIEVDDATRAQILRGIFSEIDELALDVQVDTDKNRDSDDGERVEVRRNEHGESSVDIREGENRVRIEEKNGEIHIRTDKNNDDLEDASDDSTKNDLESNTNSPRSSFEAEADVFTDITILKVKSQGNITVLETTARTRETIITELMNEFDVTRATVESDLDFQIENRASRPEDSQITDSRPAVGEDSDDDGEHEEEDDSDDTRRNKESNADSDDDGKRGSDGDEDEGDDD